MTIILADYIIHIHPSLSISNFPDAGQIMSLCCVGEKVAGNYEICWIRNWQYFCWGKYVIGSELGIDGSFAKM